VWESVCLSGYVVHVIVCWTHASKLVCVGVFACVNRSDVGR